MQRDTAQSINSVPSFSTDNFSSHSSSFSKYSPTMFSYTPTRSVTSAPGESVSQWPSTLTSPLPPSIPTPLFPQPTTAPTSSLLPQLPSFGVPPQQPPPNVPRLFQMGRNPLYQSNNYLLPNMLGLPMPPTLPPNLLMFPFCQTQSLQSFLKASPPPPQQSMGLKRKADAPPEATEDPKPKKRKKDPNAPKLPMSAYLFFVAEQRPIIAKTHSQYSFSEVARIVGRRWRSLSKIDREPYDRKAKTARKTYEEQKCQYLIKKAKRLRGLHNEDDNHDHEPEQAGEGEAATTAAATSNQESDSEETSSSAST